MAAPLDPAIRRTIEELVDSLQIAILIAQHLEQDATAVTRNLRRATDALRKLQADGGDR